MANDLNIKDRSSKNDSFITYDFFLMSKQLFENITFDIIFIVQMSLYVVAILS